MSALTVYELAGASLDLSSIYVDHSPERSVTLTGVTGTFVAGQTITFALSALTGTVVSWTPGTGVLVYYATTARRVVQDSKVMYLMPFVGETVSGPSPGAGTVNLVGSVADTFINDGRTFLFCSNAEPGDVIVRIVGQRSCSAGGKHSEYYLLPTGYSGPIGPFDRSTFNDKDGKVRVEYIGTATVAGMGVAAVRVFKAQ